MPARRSREVNGDGDTSTPQPLTKRRKTGPNSYAPGPSDSPASPELNAFLAQVLELARAFSLMSLDSAETWIGWLRKKIAPASALTEAILEDALSTGSYEQEDRENGEIVVRDESPLDPSEIRHSTPRPDKLTFISTYTPLKLASNSIPWTNGDSISITSTPPPFRSISPATPQRSISSNKLGLRIGKDGHLHRRYKNRPHIFQSQHDNLKAKVQEAIKEEHNSLTSKFHQIHKKSGGKLTEEVAKESLLAYSQSLTNIDVLSAQAAQIPNSRSEVNLSKTANASQDIHSYRDIFEEKDVKARRHSVSTSDSVEYFKMAIEHANSTLKEPRPVPFTPTLDQLKLAQRHKNQLAEDLLRPKLKPPQPLTPEEESQVDAILRKRGVISKCAREQVSDQDIARLYPCQWLNDEIINFYGAMLLQRSEDCKENPPKGKNTFLKVHYFSTFFWPKLKDEGYDKGRLAKWTKKFDIFQKDVVLIPVNHHNAHWTGAAINFRLKRIESYDSMGTERHQVFKVLRAYLDQEHRNKKKTPFDFTGWQDHSITSPKQDNGYDCGVFTCSYLQGLSRGDDYVRFSQEDMPNLRRRMIWEIGYGRLHDGP